MLQAVVIGHLGADAEVKNVNGKEFITLRIANTDKWTDDAGQTHENTTWVDCIMNGHPKVTDYLKKGQQVYATGGVSLRVFSSAKDRCMKAGLTINVSRVELLGGRSDDVPSVLYYGENGQEVNVGKYFYAPAMQRSETEEETIILVSKSGEKYQVDRQGWVTKER